MWSAARTQLWSRAVLAGQAAPQPVASLSPPQHTLPVNGAGVNVGHLAALSAAAGDLADNGAAPVNTRSQLLYLARAAALNFTHAPQAKCLLYGPECRPALGTGSQAATVRSFPLS